MVDADCKNILFVSPAFFGYEKKIQQELESQGWNVTFFDTRPSNTFVTKALIRLGANFLIRNRLKKHHNLILETIKMGKFSRILFVNPEGFNVDFFIRLREVSPTAELRLYLWDSLDNKPLIKPTLRFYNKCFTFDRADSKQLDNFNFLPLFYCSEYARLKLKEDRDYDFAFIGTVHSQRMKIVQSFCDISVRDGMNFFYYLFIQSRVIYWFRRIMDVNFSKYKSYTFNFKSLSIDDILGVFASTKAVIDIEHDKQKGLTMRTFEVLASGVKLITTNKDIVNYDLYHPNNVYVIDRYNVEFDPAFLQTPFNPYPPEILEKYNLSSWVRTITE